MESDTSTQDTPSRASRRASPVVAGWAIGGAILSIFVILAIMVVLVGPTISYAVFINIVDPGSPADDAGVVDGEVITEINGEKLQSAQAMQELIFDSLGQPMMWTLMHAETGTIVVREVTPLASPAAGQRATGVVVQNVVQTEGRRAQLFKLLPIAYVGIGVLAMTQLFAMWRRRTRSMAGQLGTS